MPDSDDLTVRYRRQDAVYWERTGTDQFGDPTYADPVEIKVRWTDTTQEFLDGGGDRVLSNSIVLVNDKFPLGSMLRKGTIADLSDPAASPVDIDGAYEIRRITETPNTRATKFLRRAWL
jgi:hypothetical protein